MRSFIKCTLTQYVAHSRHSRYGFYYNFLATMCFLFAHSFSEYLWSTHSTVAIAPEVVVGPGPLYILRETPDQSDSTVNSDVLESILRCGGVFLKLIFQMVSPY